MNDTGEGRTSASDTEADDIFERLPAAEFSFKPPPPLIRYEGWQHFMEWNGHTRPAMPSADEFAAFSDGARRQFANARKRYHAGFGPIATPILQKITKEAIELTVNNLYTAPGARSGLVLDGIGTAGKSTIVTGIGKRYESQMRKKLGRPIGGEKGRALYLPVAYLSLGSDLTLGAFNKAFARFLGVPGANSKSAADLAQDIIDTAAEVELSMVIVDDIHFLRMHKDKAQDVNNHLKFFASTISATFIYAGINVRKSGLLSEGLAKDEQMNSQTAHRFKYYEVSAFEPNSDAMEELLASFDQHILLMNHKPGTLRGLRKYFSDRTGGLIGAVSHLVRMGANRAIDTGTEAIDQTLLDAIRLDDAAEAHDAVARPSRHKARKKRGHA